MLIMVARIYLDLEELFFITQLMRHNLIRGERTFLLLHQSESVYRYLCGLSVSSIVYACISISMVCVYVCLGICLSHSLCVYVSLALCLCAWKVDLESCLTDL